MISIRHNWPQPFFMTSIRHNWPPFYRDVHSIQYYHLQAVISPSTARGTTRSRTGSATSLPAVPIRYQSFYRAGRALIFLAVRQAKRNATWRRRILRLLWHSEIVCNLYILFPFKNQCWKRVPIRRKKQGDCNNNTLTLTKEKRQFLQIIEKIFNILCTFCTLKKQIKKSLKKKLSFNRISNLSL